VRRGRSPRENCRARDAGRGVTVRERATELAAVIYPWCAFYGRLGENCGFTTFEQCRATISAIGGYCGANPWYRGTPSPNGSPPQIRR
jgi:Protein of unknown function (DUF3551)